MLEKLVLRPPAWHLAYPSSLTTWWIPMVWVWLCVGKPWLWVSLHWPLFLEESCPARGWQCSWEIDEHAGLWLGGTLQRRSWLQGEFFIKKISTLDYSISAIIFTISWEMMNMLNAGMYMFAFAKCWGIMHLCMKDYASGYVLCIMFKLSISA